MEETEPAETPEATQMEAVPFAPLSKNEMIEHLRDVHGYPSLRPEGGYSAVPLKDGARITKDNLEKIHQSFHRVLEHPGRVDRFDAQYGVNMAMVNNSRVRIPSVEHVHLSSVTEEDKQRLERIKSEERITDKPLSANERKVLLELINNDFGATKQRMKEMAADALQAQIAELKETHQSNNDAERKFKAEYQRLHDEIRGKIREMVEEMDHQGIKVTHAAVETRNIPTFTYDAYDKEVKRAQQENQTMLQRALMTLERQRLTAVRRVLINGVTEEAAKLLETVPTAEQLMVEAAREQSARELMVKNS